MMRRIRFWPLVALLLCFGGIFYVLSTTPSPNNEEAAFTLCEEDAPQAETTAAVAISEAAPPVAEEPAFVIRDDISCGENVLDAELQQIMQECAERYDVSYALLLAFAEVESSFDPDALSSTNDHGLMQINECNFGWLRDLDIGPETHAGNIEAGAYMISQYIHTYFDVEKAAMAYNLGVSGANAMWKKGVYQTDHSQKISDAFSRWLDVLKE